MDILLRRAPVNALWSLTVRRSTRILNRRLIACASLTWLSSCELCEVWLKHTARELAIKADVPVVPGSKDLVASEEEAVEFANKLGYPVCCDHDVLLGPELIQRC